MQVLKFCLPKESISEQLDCGYIDTGQKKESNKISGNYYLTVLVYIVNDEIQCILILSGFISALWYHSKSSLHHLCQ